MKKETRKTRQEIKETICHNADTIMVEFKVKGKEYEIFAEIPRGGNFAQSWEDVKAKIERDLFFKIIDELRRFP